MTTTTPHVIAIVRDTLGLADTTAVTPEHLLFYDLEFTSLDLLDLLFRLEERFDIQIPDGTLYGLARGDMADAEFCEDGVLTRAGRDRLMALLHDTPPELFPDAINANALPRYCTVAAFARLVDHKLGRTLGRDAGAELGRDPGGAAEQEKGDV